MESKKSKAEIRREEILSAALKCFNKKGYYKTSLEDIAEKLGLTKAAIYYYFTSKKKLFIELFHYKVDGYFQKVSMGLQYPKSDPFGYLWSRIEKSEEIFKKNIDVFKFCLEFLSVSTKDAEIKKEVTRFFEHRLHEFTAMMQRGIDEGKFRQCDTESVGILLYYLSMGLFLTHFSVSKNIDHIGCFKNFMDIFYHGIVPKDVT